MSNLGQLISEEAYLDFWAKVDDPQYVLDIIEKTDLVAAQLCPKCEVEMNVKISSAKSLVSKFSGGCYVMCPVCHRTKKPEYAPPYQNIRTNVLNLIKLIWCAWKRETYVNVEKIVPCRTETYTLVKYATFGKEERKPAESSEKENIRKAEKARKKAEKEAKKAKEKT